MNPTNDRYSNVFSYDQNCSQLFKSAKAKYSQNYLDLSYRLQNEDWIAIKRETKPNEGYEVWKKNEAKIKISYPYLSNKEFQWVIGIIESTKRVNE